MAFRLNMADLTPELVSLLKAKNGDLDGDTRAMLRDALVEQVTEDSSSPEEIEKRTMLIDSFIDGCSNIFELSARSLERSCQEALAVLGSVTDGITAIAMKMATPRAIYEIGGMASSISAAEMLIDSVVDELRRVVMASKFDIGRRPGVEYAKDEPEDA
jgi:hypothetical protein